MAYLEIEKKYLIDKLPQFFEDKDYEVIEQVYFTNPYDFSDIRIRNRNGEKILTYKTYVKKGIKREYEINLPDKEYDYLFNNAPHKEIVKHRYTTTYLMNPKINIEVDVFQGDLEGLIIAEIELESEEDFVNFIPEDWFGEEITGQMRYSNNALCVYGRPKKYNIFDKIKNVFKLWKIM